MSRKTIVAGVAALLLGIVQPAAIAGAGAPQEGITVHGHWVVDIRNPDGTLASHLDFENALTPSGAQTVAGLLSRQYGAGTWMVILYGGPNATPAAPCPQPPNALGLPAPPGAPCILGEASFFSGATPPPGVGVVTLNHGPSTVSLTGSVQATANGTIGMVESHLLCPAPAGSCQDADMFGNVFSAAVLQTPQTVAANQVIQVSVTFSFS
ncbi:MAG TPA: hypothetical protein VFI56_22055 [Vicinamibacterales bacterium]|jgi:hypothetical protein|nr:hypothetical protein [Vicinamibacterales bacterium]